MAALFLVLMRCIGFVVAAPLLGHRAVPGTVKAALAAFLAIAVSSYAVPATNELPMLLAVPVEVVIGLALGFLLGLGMRATEVIARLLSLQAGLSLASVYGPTFDDGGTALDPFFSVITTLLFLGLGLHLAMVGALARSFGPLPLGGAPGPDFAMFGVRMISLALELGFQIALPLALALLLAELAVALLSRAIPTINVFILGLPMTLLACFVVVIVALPILIDAIGHVLLVIQRSVGTGTLP